MYLLLLGPAQGGGEEEWWDELSPLADLQSLSRLFDVSHSLLMSTIEGMLEVGEEVAGPCIALAGAGAAAAVRSLRHAGDGASGDDSGPDLDARAPTLVTPTDVESDQKEEDDEVPPDESDDGDDDDDYAPPKRGRPSGRPSTGTGTRGRAAAAGGSGSGARGGRTPGAASRGRGRSSDGAARRRSGSLGAAPKAAGKQQRRSTGGAARAAGPSRGRAPAAGAGPAAVGGGAAAAVGPGHGPAAQHSYRTGSAPSKCAEGPGGSVCAHCSHATRFLSDLVAAMNNVRNHIDRREGTHCSCLSV